MTSQPRLLPGDPAPWFTAKCSTNPSYPLDSVAGNYILLTFVGQGSAPAERALLAQIAAGADAFDDINARWFIVSADPAEDPTRLPLRLPGIRAFFDGGRRIHDLYGVEAGRGAALSFLLSPRLTVIAVIGDADPTRHAAAALGILNAQPAVAKLGQALGPPPILMIAGVFEPALCAALVEGHERNGGEASAFMRDERGKTVPKFDKSFKVRRDWIVDDPKLSNAITARFQRRVVPEIRKAYNFQVTHMERHLVACYDAAEGGHFRAHRDNTALGTAHRQFACSLNLNAEGYTGGDLRFPEFGPELYRPPTGGCVIFSCSLLHEATRVTSGKRYVFLPFLHNEEAEKLRRNNMKFVEPESGRAAAGRASTVETG